MFQAKCIFGFLILLCVSFCSIEAQSILELEESVVLGNNSDANPDLGTMRWTGKDFEVWNGIIWASLTKEEGAIKDINGNIYNTVAIGNQVWMQENLRVNRYRDGSLIDAIGSNGYLWRQYKSGAYCWYDNDRDYELLYGKLYNCYAVIDSRGLCPSGWHVPSEEDWNELRDYLDPNAMDNPSLPGGQEENIAGGEMKSKSGFTGLLGGNRQGGEFFNFVNRGNVGFWWSSSIISEGLGVSRSIHSFDADMRRGVKDMSSGLSVRCLKD